MKKIVPLLFLLVSAGELVGDRINPPWPEGDGDIVIACKSEASHLRLSCPLDTVITANVYGGVDKQPEGSCNYTTSMCLANLTEDSGLRCLWRNAACEFRIYDAVLGCGPPKRPTSLMALHVKCVPASMVFQISGPGPRIHLYPDSSVYILDDSFPLWSSTRYDNSTLTISNLDNVTLTISCVFLSMNQNDGQYVKFHILDESGTEIGVKQVSRCSDLPINISAPSTRISLHNPGALFLKILLYITAFNSNDSFYEEVSSTSGSTIITHSETTFSTMAQPNKDMAHTSVIVLSLLSAIFVIAIIVLLIFMWIYIKRRQTFTPQVIGSHIITESVMEDNVGSGLNSTEPKYRIHNQSFCSDDLVSASADSVFNGHVVNVSVNRDLSNNNVL